MFLNRNKKILSKIIKQLKDRFQEGEHFLAPALKQTQFNSNSRVELASHQLLDFGQIWTKNDLFLRKYNEKENLIVKGNEKQSMAMILH